MCYVRLCKCRHSQSTGPSEAAFPAERWHPCQCRLCHLRHFDPFKTKLSFQIAQPALEQDLLSKINPNTDSAPSASRRASSNRSTTPAFPGPHLWSRCTFQRGTQCRRSCLTGHDREGAIRRGCSGSAASQGGNGWMLLKWKAKGRFKIPHSASGLIARTRGVHTHTHTCVWSRDLPMLER